MDPTAIANRQETCKWVAWDELSEKKRGMVVSARDDVKTGRTSWAFILDSILAVGSEEFDWADRVDGLMQ
jgi:hypothetical protein